MKTIYFDNAATSWPKPTAVREAIEEYFGEAGGNPGRAGHRMSIAALRIVEESRNALAQLFQAGDPSRIIFAHNATHALNTAIYGTVRPGDRVVTTSVEHNSVMRPLRHLESLGVELVIVNCAPDGTINPNDVARELRKPTRLFAAVHGSNVSGAILPLAELAAVAHEHGVLILADAAQTAGAWPINVDDMGIDLLAFTGHKALLGPTGTGGLFVRDGLQISPLMRGGTGSASAQDTQPEFLPDALESGTPNVAGIAGLGAGVRLLLDTGVEKVRAQEHHLVRRFLEGSSAIPGLICYGPSKEARAGSAERCGVVSFNIKGAVPSEVGQILEQSFGILARTGLHCAPWAHKTLGTFPEGTVRFSFGWFNTESEIDSALGALKEIAGWAAKSTSASGAK